MTRITNKEIEEQLRITAEKLKSDIETKTKLLGFMESEIKRLEQERCPHLPQLNDNGGT